MAKEKRLNGNIISRRFSTMLPLDVAVGLDKFTKEYTTTGLGKFDYGVAIRFLLKINNLTERLDDLEKYIMDVESRLNQPQEQKVIEEDIPKTFGTKLEEVKDE